MFLISIWKLKLWLLLRHLLKAHLPALVAWLVGCRAGEMASEISIIFYAFGSQLNAFMSVGILLKYSRRKLPQFE